MWTMALDIGHEYGSRDARDHLKDVLDQAESGGVVVIRRRSPVVVISRDAALDALRAAAPVPVLSSVVAGQFSFWVDGAPIHASGDDLDRAEEAFLDALVDYAQLWFDQLSSAPNHTQHQRLALLVAMCAADRDQLRLVIFGDD